MSRIKAYLKSLGMQVVLSPGGYYICRYPRNYRLIVVFKCGKPDAIKIYNEALKYKGPIPPLKEFKSMMHKYKLIK